MKLTRTIKVICDLYPIEDRYYITNDNGEVQKVDKKVIDMDDSVVIDPDEPNEGPSYDPLFYQILDKSDVFDKGFIPVFYSDDLLQVIIRDEDNNAANSIAILLANREIVISYLGVPDPFDNLVSVIESLKGDREILYTEYIRMKQ